MSGKGLDGGLALAGDYGPDGQPLNLFHMLHQGEELPVRPVLRKWQRAVGRYLARNLDDGVCRQPPERPPLR